VHLCRLSSAAGIEIVRQAKAQGLPITADVSINSLMLTDVDIGFFNSAMRLNPPLRQGRDRDALQAALADGTLDALVSDHTPVSEDEKLLPFGEATPGGTGVELLLSLALKAAGLQAGEAASLPGEALRRALGTVTQGPVKVLGDALGSLATSAGRIVQGGVADLCVFDPRDSWRVQPEALVSQGKHTPFAYECTGMEMPGRVRLTVVAGQVAHEAQVA
jgi:dihydroorotase